MKESNKGKEGQTRETDALVKAELDKVIEFLSVLYPGEVILWRVSGKAEYRRSLCLRPAVFHPDRTARARCAESLPKRVDPFPRPASAEIGSAEWGATCAESAPAFRFSLGVSWECQWVHGSH